MHLFRTLCCLLGVFCLTTGCSDAPEDASTTSKPASYIKLEHLTSKAWLRDQLPENTLGYLRVPSPWFIFSGQSNGFKYAQGNSAHVEQLKKIQEGIKNGLLSELSANSLLNKFLINQLDGPVEIAFVQPDAGQMMPLVLLASHLKDSNLDTFKASFSAAISSEKNIQVNQPTDANGSGVLTIQGTQIFYQFSSNTRELILMAGMGVSVETMKTLLTTMTKSSEHAMYAAEQEIDSSGLGFFGWFNPKTLYPVAKGFLSSSDIRMIEQTGINKMNGAALGYGTSNGKARLKVLLDNPEGGVRQFLPDIDNQFELAAIGQVGAFASLAIPTAQSLKKIEDNIKESSGRLPRNYRKFKKSVQKSLEFSLEELLAILGPEVFYFSDSVGDFAAIRLNNKQQFYQLIQSLESKGILEYRSHEKNGLKVHYVTTPMIMAEDLGEQFNRASPVVKKLFNNLKSHYYWTEEAGFILLANVPQALFERASRQDRVLLQSWLDSSQQQKMASALLGFSFTSDKLSRSSYHFYIQLVSLVADISGAEFDVFSLPVAADLGFSDKGTLGFSLNISQPYISLEFVFEQSVFDIIHGGGGYQTAAVIGILAAVAIPAYQDYVKRAKAIQIETERQVLENQARLREMEEAAQRSE